MGKEQVLCDPEIALLLEKKRTRARFSSLFLLSRILARTRRRSPVCVRNQQIHISSITRWYIFRKNAIKMLCRRLCLRIW